MSTELIRAGSTGSLVANQDRDDPFSIVFAPARPALAAAMQLHPLLRLIGTPLLDVGHAAKHRDAALERCAAIPRDKEMYAARKQFEAAEQEPAPEPWLHAAIGLTLDSMPGAESLPPSFRFGLVDLMMHDEDVHGDYRPGFSYAVVAKAAREIRRTCECVPSQATFLKACTKHRAGFRKLVSLTERLIELRQNSEDVLQETGDLTIGDIVGDDGWFDDDKPEEGSKP
jgi:hypothetical protein